MKTGDGSVRLGRIHLHVRDLDRATRFYSQVLGLQVARAAPGLVWLSSGQPHYDVALHAGAPDAAAPPIALGCASIGFEVRGRARLAELCDRLTRSGARVAALDHGISWSVHTTDPDGNKVEVFCDMTHETSGRAVWNRWGRAIGLAELQQAGADAPSPATA